MCKDVVGKTWGSCRTFSSLESHAQKTDRSRRSWAATGGHKQPQEQSGLGYRGHRRSCHHRAPGVAGAGKAISEFPISLSLSFGQSPGPRGTAGTRLRGFLTARGPRGGTTGLTVPAPLVASAEAGAERRGEEEVEGGKQESRVEVRCDPGSPSLVGKPSPRHCLAFPPSDACLVSCRERPGPRFSFLGFFFFCHVNCMVMNILQSVISFLQVTELPLSLVANRVECKLGFQVFIFDLFCLSGVCISHFMASVD